MANSADPDQLASSEADLSGFMKKQLIWTYTVCKGRAYPGSAGQGLITVKTKKKKKKEQEQQYIFL